MRRTLRTKRSRARYAKRKAIVEPVFRQRKQGRGFRQCLLRGMRKVRGNGR
ncbi:MAG: transposase [Nitrospira sp.]|nr:transposase [Nitrospira sp.]